MLPEVVYRDATAQDAEDLSVAARDAFVETFGHTYQPADLQAFIASTYGPHIQAAELADPAAACRLALAGGAIAGFCMIGPYALPFDAARARPLELKRLYVRQPWQGAGIAAPLVAWAIDAARARGADALLLGVWGENARAQRFYARYGFQKVGDYLFVVGSARDEEDILRLDLA